MNVAEFTNQLAQDGLALTNQQAEQFEMYYKLLLDWNQKMNLTAITDKEGVYLKHFYDSLSIATFYDFKQNISLVDVGAGAGFPSIPLKICYPQLQITIVDSLQKRITFLKELIAQLGLQQVHLFHARVESFAQLKEHREQYDLALARAVARLSILSEYCLPLVKRNGHFLAMKGAKGEEELREAERAIQILGAQVSATRAFQLPFDEGERFFILMEKITPTPKKYPRQAGIPAKEPLLPKI